MFCWFSLSYHNNAAVFNEAFENVSVANVLFIWLIAPDPQLDLYKCILELFSLCYKNDVDRHILKYTIYLKIVKWIRSSIIPHFSFITKWLSHGRISSFNSCKFPIQAFWSQKFVIEFYFFLHCVLTKSLQSQFFSEHIPGRRRRRWRRRKRGFQA